MRIKFRSLVVVSVVALTATILQASPASALSSEDIRLSALSVNAGMPVRVEIPYLYDASTCSMYLSGPKKTTAVKVKVKNSVAKAALPTKGLPTGSYVVRVNCGKGLKATSSSFSIVPPGSPTTATCDVTDRGFSAGAYGYTPYGIQVTNRSPALTATSVQLSIAFLDGSGQVLATTSAYVMDIPPNESVLEGGSEKVSNVASMRVDAVCKSTAERTTPRLRGQAQTIAPRDSEIYPLAVGGQIPNPLDFVVSASSEMEYVVRNAAGAITGGGSTYPDAFIPVGATGTWSDISSVLPTNVASLDWVMDTEAQ